MPPEPHHPQAAPGRAGALVAAVECLAGAGAAADGAVDAVALGLVDAILAADGDALQGALAALRAGRVELARAGRDELAGAATAFGAGAHWALERLPSPGEAALVAPDGRAARFLAVLEGGGGEASSAHLREALGTDDTQVSRLGRRLLDAGLVTRRKAGRFVSWRITPRAQAALGRAGGPAGDPPRRAGGTSATDAGGDVGWWRDLIRTAWRAPQPAGHASGDPERERILRAARALHEAQGVASTTWRQIAERAGVPVAAVSGRFATVEDLVPACGGLAVAEMRLPPPADAPAQFAAGDPEGRLRELARLCFAVYRRAAPAVETVRREAPGLPLLANALEAIEESLDALAAAALGPAGADDPHALHMVRVLSDVSFWRTLTAAGLDDDAAADAATRLMAGRLGAVAAA